jgi:succinate dehydrogenase hydrophobic anchor subunit
MEYYHIIIILFTLSLVVSLWIIKHLINGFKSVIQDYIKNIEVNNIIINLVKFTSTLVLVLYIINIYSYIITHYYI